MFLEEGKPNYSNALHRLCVRCPLANEEPLLQQVLSSEACDSQTLLRVLQALLVTPGLTLPTATVCRPVLLATVASLVDDALRGDGSAAGRPAACIAAALVQTLTVAQHVEREVVRYFSCCPAPCQHLFDTTGAPAALPEGLTAADLARCTLWGMQHSSNLRGLWQWTTFLPLLSYQRDADVQWCGVHCMGLVLGGADTLTSEILQNIMQTSTAAECAIRWHTACAAIAAEEAAMFCAIDEDKKAEKERKLQPTESDTQGRKRKTADLPLHHGWPVPAPLGYTSVCGLDIPRHKPEDHYSFPSSSFSPPDVQEPYHGLVMTPTMQRNMRAFALGLCIGSPILLEGPPSTGKSALIAHLASDTGNAADMVRVHLDDQTDSKTLMGAYICTSKPGEFVWQPGALTQAVTQGSWVVIEDINLASAEVLATLLPLVEHRTLHVPSRGEELTAARGFQLIATVTSDPGAVGTGAYGSSQAVKDFLGGLFHNVRMEPVPLTEQMEIVSRLFPALAPLVPHAIASLSLVQGALRQRVADDLQAGGGVLAERVKHAMSSVGLRVGECNLGRYFSFRDLLKWARRMATVHGPLLGRALRGAAAEYQNELAAVPIAVREASFIEAADVLCSAVNRHELADKLLAALAALWAVPTSAAEQYSQLSKPTVSLQNGEATIGRVSLPIQQQLSQGHRVAAKSQSRFAQMGHSMRLMERVAVSVANSEPVLLVGETGTGKTTLVQEVATRAKAKIVVINLSQQTDSSDLIGGFRPLQPADAVAALLQHFVDLVRRTWQRGNNEEFLERVVKMSRKRRWQQMLKAYKTAIAKVGGINYDASAEVANKSNPSLAEAARETKKPRRVTPLLDTLLREEWTAFRRKVDAAEASALAADGGFAFGFFEGALVQAVREGWWLLLDEINLAPAEALERIANLLEDNGSSITVVERGDMDAVVRHPHFRLFGAMNPATDAGKKDLPAPLRNRFTEIWVGEPRQREDLAAIVAGHLIPVAVSAPVAAVVDFYLAAKKAADSVLQDGAGHKPAYNLRTLSRALEYASTTLPVYGMQRALYDGFAMSFLTQLDPGSTSVLEKLLVQHLIGEGTSLKGVMSTSPSPPSNNCVLFDHYWVEMGEAPVAETRDADGKGGVFVATPAVTQHLRNLARAVLLRKYPILLQGPTSSGKTSLVAHLAAQTGHHFVRINNHEQTDLQEYLGSYISDERGRLVFQEGLLVQAVRNGHWIVLDELNLAPTEVLEALNRLLDDNRELFVPELQEVVQPHPHFMLFATQNPPGLYAGRKTLSRAFRSRFLELHVEDIPDDELHIILEKRCTIAPSYAKKLVEVMRELQRRRALSNVFAGRHGFITPRDLFRWAGRGAVGYQQLAEDGFAVLGERLRSCDERTTVLQVLEKLIKTKIDMQRLYDSVNKEELGLDDPCLQQELGRLVWTKGFRRMYWLLDRCLEHLEPALLVGETGIGKTTVCQLAAFNRKQKLRIINCNQHTETADFLGGYRPNRSRERAAAAFQAALDAFNVAVQEASLDITVQLSSVQVSSLMKAVEEAVQITARAEKEASKNLHPLLQEMSTQASLFRAPFQWVDGPLVAAMKEGDILLIDELNLAEDAVLERLNSVLEPSRSLTLAEKGGKTEEVIIAHPNFRVIATMNPGGDYGKKELSPALSNRFTSIWVPSIDNESELKAILNSRLDDSPELVALPAKLLAFWSFYERDIAPAARQILSVRDLLTWIQFINAAVADMGALLAYFHGAHVAFIDGIGLGVGLSEEAAEALRMRCHRFLVSQLSPQEHAEFVTSEKLRRIVSGTEKQWGMAPFFVERLQELPEQGLRFDFNSPTTAKNTFRVLRAMKLRKPILLEGSPGVGKTSLIAAIARAAGRKFVRINLSEQTDMMDLLGADLPVEGGGAGEFAWADGPLLQAIKSGAWVLMDELNLANQTVLEGLNALLDHRAEVFIPELNTTFKCSYGFRIFGAQNPLQEGGGRKGLPKSFLNRFSRVHVELLERNDLLFIAGMLHPTIPFDTLNRMVNCLGVLQGDARDSITFGSTGGPWEFNLRDLLRWCELVVSHIHDLPDSENFDPIARHYADMLLLARMRTGEDREHAFKIIYKYFAEEQADLTAPQLSMTPASLQVGWTKLERYRDGVGLKSLELHSILNCWTPILECLAECVSREWMCLLVGPSGTGKTTIVRILAQLCGRSLLELPLNSGTDTSDLLGGFEQVDLSRKRHLLVSSMQGLLAKMVAVEMCLSSPSERSSGLRSLALTWSASQQQESPASVALEARKCLASLTDLAQPYPECYRQMIVSLMRYINEQVELILCAGDSVDGRFEWVDGSLTRAIIEGRWVVLDNANLCNPSVLDRLNPLLEPHGLLYLNECGCGSQGPRVISPHPDFRMFLTFDPKHGEVSRAMRNRGIELFMLPNRNSGLIVQNWIGSEAPGNGEDDPSSDLESLLGIERLPGSLLPSAIIKTHSQIRSKALERHRRPPSARELRRWASMLRELCSRGFNVRESLKMAFEHVYVQPEDDDEGRAYAEGLYLDIFGEGTTLPSDEDVGWFRPAGWPSPMTAGTFAAESDVSQVSRDSSIALYWGGRLVSVPKGGMTAALLSDVKWLTSHGVGVSVSVPGAVLGHMLLGLLKSGGKDHSSFDDETARLWAGSCLRAALCVYMERGIGSPGNYLRWASAYLGQCSIAESPASAVLVDAVEVLRCYFTHPLLARGSSTAGSPAQLILLRESIAASVVLRRVSLNVSEHGTQAASETLLQLSGWRYENPRSRSKVPSPHPAVDWLWPLLSAVQECEEWLMNPEQIVMSNVWVSGLAEKLEKLQQERWALLYTVQLDLTTSSTATFNVSAEVIFYRWMRLRSTIAAFIEEFGLNGPEATGKLKQMATQMDATVGLENGLPAAPRLWKAGGKPLLPVTSEHLKASNKLLELCGCFRAVPKAGCGPLQPIIATAVARAQPARQDVMEDETAEHENAQTAPHVHEQIENAIIAMLVSDIDLRRIVMEGTCLFEAGAHVKGSGSAAGASSVDAVYAGVIETFEETARAFSTAAAVVADPAKNSGSSCQPTAAGREVETTKLPLALPAHTLSYPAAQEMQMELAVWADLSCSKSQLHVLAGHDGAVLGLLCFQDSRSSIAGALRLPYPRLARIVQDVISSGCRDVYEGVPYNQLCWLIDASAPGVHEVSLASPEWHLEMLRSLAHEAWYRWHRGLWWWGADSFPSKSTLSNNLRQARHNGPIRLHLSTLTMHAAPLTSGSGVEIKNRMLRMMQLQTAARQLRSAYATKIGGDPAVAVAEWRAAVLVSASVFASHAPDMHQEDQAGLLAAIEQMGDMTPDSVNPELLGLLDRAIERCEHTKLRELGSAVLLPAIQALFAEDAPCTSTKGLGLRGRAWALLGLARLHLCVPPPGSDPAAVFALQRHYTLDILQWRLRPELEVRKQYSRLPGGPFEHALADLHLEEAAMLEGAADLVGKSPPRPSPPQYLAIREDMVRFADGLAAVPRLLRLVEAAAGGAEAAMQEADVWQENAAAAVERMKLQYPWYRDIIQPIQLAVYEIRYGLSLATGAAHLALAGRDGNAALLQSTATNLMAFPRARVISADESLQTSGVQYLVSSMASEHLETREARQAAGLIARLNLLRVALCRAQEDWRSAPIASSRSEAACRLEDIFNAIVTVWEDMKEEEARRAAEEAELFKTKTRSTVVRSEEEEAEVDFHQQFPDHFSAFSDLVDDEDGPPLESGGDAAPSGALPLAADEGGAAAFSAKNFILGTVLEDVIQAHAELYAGERSTDTNTAVTGTAAFLRSYDLGMRLVQSAGGLLPAQLDDDTLTGHLYALTSRARELRVGEDFSGSTADARGGDIHASRVEEAVLVQGPLEGIRARIGNLLDEWPDHPVLTQLDAIATRILSMPTTSPLKGLLTGLELLLARAQIWEETAAKHVTLGPQLKAIAALATRWRRLELDGWRVLLQGTVNRMKQGAHLGWFHLYRILLSGDSTLSQVAEVVEDFVQASPLGEYESRLDLLRAFHWQLTQRADELGAFSIEILKRWRCLAAILYNVARYYSQFVPGVQAAIAVGMVPLEKDLKDFVALAKWEDRGFYAMKASTERAQRHLHKLSRRAVDLLNQPVAGPLASAVKSMGLDDLTTPENIESLPTKRKAGRPSGSRVVTVLADTSSAAAALSALVSVDSMHDAPIPASGGKFTKRLHDLTKRFATVIDGALSSREHCLLGPALSTDELASKAASTALSLRQDVSKGAKARKKKAFVDFFKILSDRGVSKLRSSVPVEARGAQARFIRPAPGMHELLDAAGTAGCSLLQLEAAEEAWSKADAYHYATIARSQRLIEAAKRPNQDIMPAEVNIACRMTEHLLYLTHVGRESLGGLATHFGALNRFMAVVHAENWNGEFPSHQSAASERCKQRQETLAELQSLTKQTRELLCSTAELEPLAEPRRELEQAGKALDSIHQQLEKIGAELISLTQKSFSLKSGEILVTSHVQDAVVKADSLLNQVAKELNGSPHRVEPGWSALAAAFSAAALRAMEDAHMHVGSANSSPSSSSKLIHTVSEHVESAVEAALIWAQNVADGLGDDKTAVEIVDATDEEIVETLPAVMHQASERMGICRLKTLVEHIAAAMEAFAKLVDTGDAATTKDGAVLLASMSDMLSILRAATWQLASRSLALHRSVCKLAYITSSLFVGVVEEGFCIPEGGEEGEPQEGDEKITRGTGLGEGDTRGAKDISDELENEDQLLGAAQKDQEKEEEQNVGAEDGPESAKGVEMEEDFEGALEDVQHNEAEEDDEGAEDEENGERLEQQMGDVGDAAEDVDERLWGDDQEDENQKGKEEAGHDQENKVKVEDASKLDYAQGQNEPDDEQGGDQGPPPVEAPQQANDEQEQPVPGAEGDEEDQSQAGGEEGEQDEEGLGDYEDRPEDRGHVRPEVPDEEMQLPEDLNLDGVEDEGEEEEGNDGGGEEGRDPLIKDQGGTFPEQPDAMEDDNDQEQGQNGQDGEERQSQGDGDVDTPMAEEVPPADEGQEEDGAGEDDGKEDAHMIGADEENIRSKQDATQADGDMGRAAAAVDPAGAEGGAVEERDWEDDKRLEAGASAQAPAVQPPQAAAGGAAGDANGLQNDSAAAQMSSRGAEAPLQSDRKPSAAPHTEANPFRDLGSALERWRANLAMAGDAEGKEEPQADASLGQEAPDDAGNDDQGHPLEGEFRFLEQDEAMLEGDTQTLAGATHEQAGMQAGEDEHALRDILGEDEPALGLGESDDDMVDDVDALPLAEQHPLSGNAAWGIGDKTQLHQTDAAEEHDVEAEVPQEGTGGEDTLAEGAAEGGSEQALLDGIVASKLQATHLYDEDEDSAGPLDGSAMLLSEERAEELRVELDRRMRIASEGGVVSGDLEYGAQMWSRCEALTSGLVGDLAEQLRLILEPTLARKLGGEYRTGKRINMKKVIGYIASHFRKDKIWMRRTRPDKRAYQVLVAVDDSRSMAENGCGTFALEALTLICKAMARLDVGELGVVSFGGAGGAEPLHPLDRPFTDNDGVRIMSRMRFDQDNTIGDSPMVDIITSMDNLLEVAAARAAASSPAGPAALHQLVLIVADGRFHEKEALKRAARDAASRPGVLYAFIILDNEGNSILDMQSVAFVGGKPVFTKYIDTFPFPFYIVLRDTAALPRTLADLLRQWFELSSG